MLKFKYNMTDILMDRALTLQAGGPYLEFVKISKVKGFDFF